MSEICQTQPSEQQLPARQALIYDVYWEGPYSLSEVINNDRNGVKIIHHGHCLYQVYGDHPCYGHDVLLYIGKTEQGIVARMKQHAGDYHLQCEDVKLFIGSYGVFDNWEIRRSIVKYEDVDSNTLDVIESLLIYAHQPSYNSSKLCRNDFKNYRLRLFNTGKRKALLPEISTEYWNHRIV